MHVPIIKNLSLASFMLPCYSKRNQVCSWKNIGNWKKLSPGKCPLKGTLLLKIFPFSVVRNRIPCSACILKWIILSFQERGVSLALILWGHMSERHTVLVALQAPCYSHCWTIRWVIRFYSSWPVLWIVWDCQYISSMVWPKIFAWGRERTHIWAFVFTLCAQNLQWVCMIPSAIEELRIPCDKY